MSAAAPSPPTLTKRPGGLLRSTIGLKLVMAATGVILSGFVLGHMAGNLEAFGGQKALDAYGAALRVFPPLLLGARLVLLGSVALHIWAYLALLGVQGRARPQGNRLVAHHESTYASRTMRFTGPLLLAFIIYHVLHLTTGTVHPDFEEGKVWHNLTTGLRVVPVSVFYLIALAALAFHLHHGVWSLFQTLGVGASRYESFGRRFATVFTVVVVLGFAAIPLSVLAGVLK